MRLVYIDSPKVSLSCRFEQIQGYIVIEKEIAFGLDGQNYTPVIKYNAIK